jgi:RNA polymerase sigma-54 factor
VLEEFRRKIENPFITIGDAQSRNRKKKGKTDKNKTDWIEQIADKSFSLEEQLLSQLNFKKYSKLQLSIIRTLLEYLDENGYLRGDLKEIAEQRKVSTELVEDCLMIIQGLEPVGVAARNLQECLLIQMEWEYPDDELAQKIITDHFELLAEKKWKLLAKELQVSMKQIQDVFDKIQELNPKPCAKFSSDHTHYIVPDAIIEVTSEGISVRLWESAIPKINFNESYYTQISMSGDRQVGKFLQEKFQDFQWIMKSIEQRKETLARVIMKITEKQPEFFLKGPQYLNPMTMKELAQELDVHESTISRAVREKFVQTPSGTISLKSFFSSTIQTVSDENTSSSLVKNTIARVIEKENKQTPFSDQEIVEMLKAQEGIVVSRRTVAKYRDQLGIPSSTKRKRY